MAQSWQGAPKLGVHLVPTFALTQPLLEARQQRLAVESEDVQQP